MAWCKLHTDIIGDPKLLRAARKGARHLHWLPWLIAFAKAADDDGRLTVNDEPAEPEDIAPQLPGATAADIAACIHELDAIGVLTMDESGAYLFPQWEHRSGAKPSDDPEAVAARVKRHREKKKRGRETTSNALQVTRDNATEVEVDVDGEVEKREMEIAPRPLANATTETEWLEPQPPYRSVEYGHGLVMPPAVKQFVDEMYGLATDKRRWDVKRQLFDAIDPTKRGAFLRRGVYVKAKDADHLARVCTAVRLDPPQQLDSAIVYVLRKLQDAETDANGRTVTEAASFDQKQTDALLERYEKAAKSAANEWVAGNRDAYAAIKARLDVQFPGAIDAKDSWKWIAYNSALLSEVRKASGFPDFETWRSGNVILTIAANA